MRILVQKYGGSSVASSDLLRSIARKIVEKRKEWDGIVVVVSAMERTTDRLQELAYTLNPSPPERELDMLLTSGERISMSLLSIAIWAEGSKAISYTGSQSGIITEDRHTGAKIIEVKAHRIIESLLDGNIVIVAGFQGMSGKREITTLGRGGSDTTAVALAEALGAEQCEIYTDVPGVFDGDPRIIKDVSKLDRLTYDEMLELTYSGAKIVHPRAIELAKANKIPLIILSAHSSEKGSVVIEKDAEMEESRITGITSQPVLFIKFGFKDEKELESLMKKLQQNKIETSQLHTASGLFTCWTPVSEERRLENLADITVIRDYAAITMVGKGFARSMELIRQLLNFLRTRRIRPAQLFVSPISVKFLVPRAEEKNLVKELHAKFIQRRKRFEKG